MILSTCVKTSRSLGNPGSATGGTSFPLKRIPSLKLLCVLLCYRQRDKSKQTDGSPVALFNMFIQRCRDQLHIVLAMSPIGDTFRNRLRKFPSLVNCCTIDWFQVRHALLIGRFGCNRREQNA